MIIKGVDSGAFVRSLLALSNAYMERVHDWEDNYKPIVYDGLDSKEAKAELKDPFDFIVVGSGYAGSLLASQLAGSGCYRVLLLEAGPKPEFDTSVPFLQPINYTHYMWDYETIPQRHSAKGMKNQAARLVAGKGLGGSSLLEPGVFLPENPRDFVRWAEQFNLQEWNREAMEPFMFVTGLKTLKDENGDDGEEEYDENNLLSDEDADALLANATTVSSIEGISLDRIRKQNPFSYLWMQAGRDMGYELHRGMDGKMYDNGGFFMPNGMTQRGFRQTPATQFLANENRKTGNLVTITNANVKKIKYNLARQAASGVELEDTQTGDLYRARTGREVILSAGAIGTARLLLQSGIGPSDHLDELEIPVIQHLPVGVTLRDRVSTNLFIKIQPLFMQSLKKQLLDMDEFKKYLSEGTGLLGSPSVFGAAVLRTEAHYNPDLLVEVKPMGLMGVDEYRDAYNYKVSTLKALDPTLDLFQNGGLQVTLTVLNPFSVGTMWLRRPENSSKDDPLELMTNPGYLQDDRDLVTLVKGAQFVEALLQTPYMKLLDAVLLKPKFPDCPDYGNASARVDYWRCTLPYLATTGRHLTSTTAMLHVVNPELKIMGVSNLRVVDESVFPEPVTGGLASSVMAVANRAASLILEENENSCFAKQKQRRFLKL